MRDDARRMGILSVIATPIGNLGDLTFRALWNLKECDAVYAEDTREILKLLNHYGLRKSVFRLDAPTEYAKSHEIAERLSRGEHIAYVTDAGTPGISDPGAQLVRHIRTNVPMVKIEAIPGPSALTAALSIAGIDATEFTFLGFLPHKKGRQTALKKIAEMVQPGSPQGGIPVVLYESPHRILKLMAELVSIHVPRVIIARELTKIHEEILDGEPSEIARILKEKGAVRGEFVVIIETS